MSCGFFRKQESLIKLFGFRRQRLSFEWRRIDCEILFFKIWISACAALASQHIVMAGHSRPKDGVLSHAYVPAIHVLFAGKKPHGYPPQQSVRPRECGDQSEFRLVAGSPLEPAPAKAGAGMNGNARFGARASKCAGKLDIFGLAPDELGGRFSRGRSVMAPARFCFMLAVGPRGRALQFHEQRRIAQTLRSPAANAKHRRAHRGS
jgi:hypothetical protein